ncbi:golgin subfamily A member 6-like protein 2 isoform X2 [Accipiter gentilis]|uniref:golgin subfamily A member 6-like protein 2 isoform X2 n=1 Tax=Astur gentilis TaxID=8957 RepID=UPI00210F3444|nr:golgin subfamily A member 6-like protein 2 isoform X2 [Accipiter gentilis]
MDGEPHGVPCPPAGGPRLEALLVRIRSLHRARQVLARETAEAQGQSEGLRRHLEQLEERQAALEGLWQQKQEALRVARLRREEVEAEGQRQEFWQQLDDITEEHKHLREAHTPAQLEAELVQLEEAREKLLSQERHLLEAEEQLGPEAYVAMRLVEQEEEGARQRLGAELGRRQVHLRHRDRLAEELERLQRPLEAPPE